MQPPWNVDPEKYADKFWIVGRSEYRDKWQAWFCDLTDKEQERYRRDNPPPASCDAFYDLYGKPRYDPAVAAEKHRDGDGYLRPPWKAFPDIGLGSIGWRMGDGEDYWHIFHEWFVTLPEDMKSAFKAKYPEPSEVEHGYPWTGFYERKERNG